MRRCCLWSLVLGGVAVLSSGCGAGLITSLANGGDGAQSTPTLRVRPSSVPLVPAPNTLRTIEISNARIAADASLVVLLTAELPPPPTPEPPQGPETMDVLQKSVVVADQGEAIRFVLDTAAIVARIGDDAAVEADVKAYLTVFVNGEQLGERMLLSLVRQPTAALVLEDKETEQFLSPLGGQVRIRVPGLLSSNADDVQVVVQVPDPERPVGSPATITRVCTETQIQLDGVPQVTCFAPGNGFPTQATIVVRDELAGESTEVTNVFYSPAIVAAQPAQGSTTGGMPVSLSGVALLPHDFDGGSPAPYAFDDVRLFFRRDGRVVELPREEFRFDASTSNQLTFTMPGSPDGRPGPVEIELRVRLGNVEARAFSRGDFQFANPDPVFGPRGAVLEQLPVAVASIRLDKNLERAPDLVALVDQDGVGYLQLLLSEQNGMFQRFGALRQVGSPNAGAERSPRDLCVGDFNGDGVLDVFVANAGISWAVHHLVLGQDRPAPPLSAQPYRVLTDGGMVRCRAADFDQDGRSDVVLLPGADAAPGVRPVVLFARAPTTGAGGWLPGESPFAAPVALPVRQFSYDAVEVADLDGDQQLDIAVVSGGEGKLDVVYGLPGGDFTPVASLDFDVPDYVERTDSPAVGLHACMDQPWSSLGLVLSGLSTAEGTPPTITVLRQTALRTFAAPTAEQTVSYSVNPAGLSLAADLDGSAPVELVVGARDEGQFYSLALLRLGQERFEVLPGVESGAESPRNIRAMAFGQALKQSPSSSWRSATRCSSCTRSSSARARGRSVCRRGW